MNTVNQVCQLTGVSPRTLHHYHAIGLLVPSSVTEAGYRLYDDGALQRLRMILTFREIGFSLKEIKKILDSPEAERDSALCQQISLLQSKAARLQNRIHFANGIKMTGVDQMNWEKIDANKLDDYSAQAEALYGKTDAYREYKAKSSDRTHAQEVALGDQVMDFFTRLGTMRHLPAESEEAQGWVRELQAFFTRHYYNCTDQILMNLGEMYAAGGSMTENIDAAGGKGTAAFAKQVISIYCGKA